MQTTYRAPRDTMDFARRPLICLLGCVLLLMSLLATVMPARAATPMCMMDTYATIVGTSGPDVLVGTPDGDVIVGLGGNDVIRGGGGNDIICGNGGSDTIYGQDGNDYLQGGPGADTLTGGAGNDELTGHEGNDQLLGNAGDDRMFGSEGQDLLRGGGGGDYLLGGTGIDALFGDANMDQLLDIGDGGQNRLDCGNTGNDWDGYAQGQQSVNCEVFILPDLVVLDVRHGSDAQGPYHAVVVHNTGQFDSPAFTVEKRLTQGVFQDGSLSYSQRVERLPVGRSTALIFRTLEPSNRPCLEGQFIADALADVFERSESNNQKSWSWGQCVD